MNAVINQEELKQLLKAAVAEVIDERRDLFVDLVEEALEDVPLARAIEEGQKSPLVDREDVIRALAGQK